MDRRQSCEFLVWSKCKLFINVHAYSYSLVFLIAHYIQATATKNNFEKYVQSFTIQLIADKLL